MDGITGIAAPLSEASGPLSEYCLALAVPLCREHDCLIGELFRGGKCKPRNVVTARMKLIVTLRTTVGMRNIGGKTYVQIFGDTNWTLNERDDWAPLSTPLIGRLIGMDHSSVVLSLQRAKKVARGELTSPSPPAPDRASSRSCPALCEDAPK